MRLLLLVFLGAGFFTAHAQKVDKYLFLAKEAEANQDFIAAAEYYRQGARVTLFNPELNFSFAECLRNQNDYSLAEKFYQLTLSSDTANQYPIALYWLATLQKNNGRYKEALTNWELLMRQNAANPSSETYRKAEREVQACTAIIKARIASYPAEMVNITTINSTDAEFAASYYNDYSMVYSHLPKNADKKAKTSPHIQLNAAIKDKQFWQLAGSLAPTINETGFSNANGSFSSDGKFFLFTRCNDQSNCQLYISRYKDGQYLQAFPLKINVTNFNSTQANLVKTSNGYVLFFSSNRPGGKGGYDIWYALADENLNLGEAKNATAINSIDDDITPFYSNKTGELFFSSTWYTGLGGFDVFRSATTNFIAFSEPVNVGKPFNSPANDTYFTLRADGGKGMLTSNREGSFSSFGSTCCNDIYEFNYPLSLIGKYPYDPETTTPVLKTDDKKIASLYSELVELLPLTLYFHNDEPDPKTLKDYTLKSYLDCYTDYQRVKANYRHENPEETDFLFESYVDRGFNKLYRYVELTNELMSLGANLTVSVKGYASPLAKSDYNINLTGRRIESFTNFLKTFENGALLPYLVGDAETNRLTIKKLPFGETKSAPNVSDNYKDQRKSVYSLAAALERRIEIVATHLDMPNQVVVGAKPNSAANEKPTNTEIRNEEPVFENTDGNTVNEPRIEPVIQSYNKKDGETQTSSNGKPGVKPVTPIEADITNHNTEADTIAAANIPQPDEDMPKPEPVYLTNLIEVDFGKVKRGQIMAKPIRFRNAYGHNITMTRVTSDCDCTNIQIPTAVLVPDEEITFSVRFDSRGKLGPQQHAITIFTKEIQNQIVIRYQVEVVP